MPLKVGSGIIDEWIWNTDDIRSHASNAALIGERISRNFKKNKNIRCFNLFKISDFIVANRVIFLKQYYRQVVPRNNSV